MQLKHLIAISHDRKITGGLERFHPEHLGQEGHKMAFLTEVNLIHPDTITPLANLDASTTSSASARSAQVWA